MNNIKLKAGYAAFSVYAQPHKIHHHAGGNVRINSSDLPDDQRSCLLSEEKSCDQNHIGIPCKTRMRDNSQQNDKRYRDMDSQEPLQGEPTHIGPPVPERYVDDEDNQTDEKEF